MDYDNELRQGALKLSDEIGVKKASEQLGVPYYTLSAWRRVFYSHAIITTIEVDAFVRKIDSKTN